jgi:biotin synthase
MSAPSPLPSPHLIADRILAGDQSALDPATLERWLTGEGEIWELMAAADRSGARASAAASTCARSSTPSSGGCPEDCGFCAQSRHFHTGVEPERFLSPDEIVSASAIAREHGSTALGLVTATRGYEDGSRALGHMIEAIDAVHRAGHTEVHASLGFVSRTACRSSRPPA